MVTKRTLSALGSGLKSVGRAIRMLKVRSRTSMEVLKSSPSLCEGLNAPSRSGLAGRGCVWRGGGSVPCPNHHPVQSRRVKAFRNV